MKTETHLKPNKYCLVLIGKLLSSAKNELKYIYTHGFFIISCMFQSFY